MQEPLTVEKLKKHEIFNLTGCKYFTMRIKNLENIHLESLDTVNNKRYVLDLNDKRFAEHLIKHFGNLINDDKENSQHYLKDSELKQDLLNAINAYES